MISMHCCLSRSKDTGDHQVSKFEGFKMKINENIFLYFISYFSSLVSPQISLWFVVCDQNYMLFHLLIERFCLKIQTKYSLNYKTDKL